MHSFGARRADCWFEHRPTMSRRSTPPARRSSSGELVLLLAVAPCGVFVVGLGVRRQPKVCWRPESRSSELIRANSPPSRTAASRVLDRLSASLTRLAARSGRPKTSRSPSFATNSPSSPPPTDRPTTTQQTTRAMLDAITIAPDGLSDPRLRCAGIADASPATGLIPLDHRDGIDRSRTPPTHRAVRRQGPLATPLPLGESGQVHGRCGGPRWLHSAGKPASLTQRLVHARMGTDQRCPAR